MAYEAYSDPTSAECPFRLWVSLIGIKSLGAFAGALIGVHSSDPTSAEYPFHLWGSLMGTKSLGALTFRHFV